MCPCHMRLSGHFLIGMEILCNILRIVSLQKLPSLCQAQDHLLLCIVQLPKSECFFRVLLQTHQTHSDMYLDKLEQPCKKAVFMLVFPREIQGISGKMVISRSQIIVLNLVCSMFLFNKGTISCAYTLIFFIMLQH